MSKENRPRDTLRQHGALWEEEELRGREEERTVHICCDFGGTYMDDGGGLSFEDGKKENWFRRKRMRENEFHEEESGLRLEKRLEGGNGKGGGVFTWVVMMRWPFLNGF